MITPPPPTRAALATTLLALLALATPLRADEPPPGTRLITTSPSGALEAWIVPGTGLVVMQAGTTVFTDAWGAMPRFDSEERLVFETAVDDGHRLHGRTTWIWSPRTGTTRRARDEEPVAPWAPVTTPADGGPIRLCVDPGHGGADPGAVGNGLFEKDVVLDVSLRFRDLLDADTADASGGGAWDVLLTRETDVSVSLLQRVTLANSFGADSFVSIHANGFGDPAANGTETFAFAEGTTAAALRDRVHDRMIEAWGLTDRGTKTANFYVLLNTAMPASLSELGFITNQGDAQVLADPAQRQEAARAHLFAVQEHHGFGIHNPGAGSTGTLKGILYDASVGPGAPISGATVSLADGTNVTTSAAGLYAFPLPAGPYTFAATAPGFAMATGTEVVTSGDVWESLGLQPADRPRLTVSLAGSQLDLDATGDAGAPVLALVASTPQLPLAPLGPKGELWPDAGSLLPVALGVLDGQGELSLTITIPALGGAAGTPVHLQAFTTDQGAPRLSNGAGFTLP